MSCRRAASRAITVAGTHVQHVTSRSRARRWPRRARARRPPRGRSTGGVGVGSRRAQSHWQWDAREASSWRSGGPHSTRRPTFEPAELVSRVEAPPPEPARARRARAVAAQRCGGLCAAPHNAEGANFLYFWVHCHDLRPTHASVPSQKRGARRAERVSGGGSCCAAKRAEVVAFASRARSRRERVHPDVVHAASPPPLTQNASRPRPRRRRPRPRRRPPRPRHRRRAAPVRAVRGRRRPVRAARDVGLRAMRLEAVHRAQALPLRAGARAADVGALSRRRAHAAGRARRLARRPRHCAELGRVRRRLLVGAARRGAVHQAARRPPAAAAVPRGGEPGQLRQAAQALVRRGDRRHAAHRRAARARRDAARQVQVGRALLHAERRVLRRVRGVRRRRRGRRGAGAPPRRRAVGAARRRTRDAARRERRRRRRERRRERRR